MEIEWRSPDLMAWKAEGSVEAWVFGPGSFSAKRNRTGAWLSPAPKVPAGTFAAGFDRLDDGAASALLKAARAALADAPVRRT